MFSTGVAVLNDLAARWIMRLSWLAGLLLATMPAVAQDTTFRVVPGKRLGPVTDTSTLVSLRTALGARNVVIRRLDIGEGMTEPGVVLFPDDSSRRAYLYWRDTVTFTQPATVLIRDRGTLWQLPAPITVGTTLEALERINQRPFSFSGFGWDYGGGVGDWDGGAITGLLGSGFDFRLVLFPTCRPTLTESEQGMVFGEVTVRSSTTLARAMCPVVSELRLEILP